MTAEVISAISVLLGVIGGLGFKLVQLRGEMRKNELASADARQSNGRLLRELDEAREEAKTERAQRGYLTVAVAELTLEIDYANRKIDRLIDRLRALGESDDDLAGIVTGMAPLDGPDTQG
jgi:CHASE3 domain sensor protein